MTSIVVPLLFTGKSPYVHGKQTVTVLILQSMNHKRLKRQKDLATFSGQLVSDDG